MTTFSALLFLGLVGCDKTPPTAGEDTAPGGDDTDSEVIGDSASPDTDAATDDTAGDDTGDTGPAPTASVTVTLAPFRPLLTLGESVSTTITLSGTDALRAEGWTVAELVLVGTATDGTEAELARTSDLALEDGAVTALWTTAAVGRLSVAARVAINGHVVGEAAAWRAAVTPEPVHVHHWAADLDRHHWVSALLAPSALGAPEADDVEWTARGAEPLVWKGDDYATADVSAYAAYLEEVGAVTTGFLVDEMFNGTAADQVIGEALSLVRAEHPELFIAAYTQGASGEAMVAGLADADLVLVEAYPADFRAYRGFGDRIDEAVAAGLEGHAVPSLSLYEATHEAELRRQVLYYRSRFPDLPGVSLFGSAQSERLAAALDEVIEDAFLAPALAIEVGESTATVRNVGGEDADDVVVSFLDADGAVKEAVSLGTVAAGAAAEAVPTLFFSDASMAAADGVMLLVWTHPRDVIPDGDSAGAWWSSLVDGGVEQDVLSGRPDLDEVYSDGQLSHATLPLDGEQPFALEATLEITDARIYGQVGLGLSSSDGDLMLTMYQGEYDNDITSDAVRGTLTWAGADGTVVKDLLPPGLTPGVYVIRLGVEADTVRGQVWDAEGALLGDTGALAINGAFVPAALVLDVRDDGPSTVSWDGGGDERVRLFGAANSSYYVDAWVSGVTVWSVSP